MFSFLSLPLSTYKKKRRRNSEHGCHTGLNNEVARSYCGVALRDVREDRVEILKLVGPTGIRHNSAILLELLEIEQAKVQWPVVEQNQFWDNVGWDPSSRPASARCNDRESNQQKLRNCSRNRTRDHAQKGWGVEDMWNYSEGGTFCSLNGSYTSPSTHPC